MARQQGLITDLLDIASRLPWKVGLGLAVVSGLAFHCIAAAFPLFPKVAHPPGLGSAVIGQMAHALASMSWRDFERLIGEAFRRRGFTVTGFGGNGADGGVDLGLAKDGERLLVQCKYWRKEQVEVTVVRELNGVIAAQGVNGGYVVTGGQFTREAREFAQQAGIQLVDGNSLDEFIGSARSERTGGNASASLPRSSVDPRPDVIKPASPACPQCGTSMVQRTAKRGKFAGQHFWSCGQYPKCTGILQIS
jgi:restriction system protein